MKTAFKFKRQFFFIAALSSCFAFSAQEKNDTVAKDLQEVTVEADM